MNHITFSGRTKHALYDGRSDGPGEQHAAAGASAERGDAANPAQWPHDAGSGRSASSAYLRIKKIQEAWSVCVVSSVMGYK